MPKAETETKAEEGNSETEVETETEVESQLELPIRHITSSLFRSEVTTTISGNFAPVPSLQHGRLTCSCKYCSVRYRHSTYDADGDDDDSLGSGGGGGTSFFLQY